MSALARGCSGCARGGGRLLLRTKQNTRAAGEKAGISSRRVGRRPDYKPKSFPWIVIYCGANAKVEEVIASTCDELSVTWRKEYFGGW